MLTCVDDEVRVLRRHSVTWERQRITGLAPADEFEPMVRAGEFEDVVDGSRHLVFPGLVNTHHHLFQSATRGLPAVQDQGLFDWLTGLYRAWEDLDDRAVRLAAEVSLAELLLHGCTTTSDHFYLFPPQQDLRLETVIEAAGALGVRLHACRGAMTLGAARGGLPPDSCVEEDDDALRDTERVLDAYHDDSDYSMTRVDIGPCSPFNCSREYLLAAAELARSRRGVLLHTHAAETLDEERFCRDRFGLRPIPFLAEHGLLGRDVYLAHCVHLDDGDIRLLRETHSAVSHAPSSNLRLASGIAPLRRLLDAGIRVGLAVDGSSSNDGGNLIAEARLALLCARGVESQLRASGAPASPLLSAADAFKLATIGGAAALNRPVLGRLTPGAAADFVMLRADDVALAGAIEYDPLAAIMLGDAPRADRVYVDGQPVVYDGRIVRMREEEISQRLNQWVATRVRRR